MRNAVFMAWGHRTGGNNCTKTDAHRTLKTLYKTVTPQRPIVCHNAPFDLEVNQVHFDLAIPPWECCHDTMVLLFLEDPHQRALALKPSSERLLGLPPDEQDKVKDWILSHAKQLEAEFGIHVIPSEASAYIAYAPGTVVKPYANGDVKRTEG